MSTIDSGTSAEFDFVAAQLGEVRVAIDKAAAHAGRKPDAVRLVAVSKYQPIAAVLAAYAAGQRDFGENYAQELADKASAVEALGLAPTWHFIGRLQRNKVRLVVQWADVIHSVDSLRLARAISCAMQARPAAGDAPARPMAIFLQVNFGEETQKGGVAPEAVQALAEAVVQLPGLRLAGLMTVPPQEDTALGPNAGAPAPAKPRAAACFRALAKLGAEVHAACGGQTDLGLSMGMSDDFASAIGVGATLVRTGTAIFGPRPRHRSAP